MAATSGTVGLTTVDVTTLIEHAFRRCGKMPSTISSEQQLAAKESLFFLLTDLVNDGINLWCIQKAILPLTAGKSTYDLPPGANKVLTCNYRTQQALASSSTVSGADYHGQVFPSAVSPTNVQITFSAGGIPALLIEYSQDGSTWVLSGRFPGQQSVVPAGAAIAADLDMTTSALYWRVRDTSGTILGISALVFSGTPSEIPMSVLNRDDYFSLPNKTFQANKSLQYWFDKQITPRIFLWPVPNTGDQVTAEIYRQIQDVGSFTNLLEVPQRWYEYVIFALAEKLFIELPTGEGGPGRLEYLERKVAHHLDRAANGESDGAPIKLLPNLRGYT